MSAHHDVVVVGAGLAGLAAARQLQSAGVGVAVVESSDAVGGRIRTDHVDGLLLDRGFQLLNPAYPEAQRVLDLDALDLKPFAAGVIASTPAGLVRMGDPRSLPLWALSSLSRHSGSLASKARFVRYAATAASTPVDELLGDDDASAIQALRAAGLDDVFIETVVRPFLAGVFLEAELSTSRRFLDLLLRSFVRGTPSVPSAGMQAIPEQLAASLDPGVVQLNTPVEAVSAGSVRTAAGSIDASLVIVATDATAAAHLLPTLEVPAGRDVTTWYFVAGQPGPRLTSGKATLIIDGIGPVLNTVVLTNAAPSYASGGRTLVAASALGIRGDGALVRVRAHLARLYGVDTSEWEHVGTYAIPYALPSMDTPFTARKPNQAGDGIILAGDYLDTASIQGALVSGRRAADAALTALGHKVTT